MSKATPSRCDALHIMSNRVCSVGGDSGVRLWEAASLNEVCHGTLSESDTLTAVTPASPDL